MKGLKAFIFDLDGVIVDTAKYHFIAWRKLADELGFSFTEKDNERLKGVSRVDSLNILLEIGNRKASGKEKEKMASLKNQWYLDMVRKMKPDEVLPGAKEFIEEVRSRGFLVALGSASKNAPLILSQINMKSYFDVIVDGSRVVNAKPNPEIFLLAARDLDVTPTECIVFEDAEAGIEAAKRAGMHCIGVGDPKILSAADSVIPGFQNIRLDDILIKL